jgi:hypothetical protein
LFVPIGNATKTARKNPSSKEESAPSAVKKVETAPVLGAANATVLDDLPMKGAQ